MTGLVTYARGLCSWCWNEAGHLVDSLRAPHAGVVLYFGSSYLKRLETKGVVSYLKKLDTWETPVRPEAWVINVKLTFRDDHEGRGGGQCWRDLQETGCTN